MKSIIKGNIEKNIIVTSHYAKNLTKKCLANIIEYNKENFVNINKIVYNYVYIKYFDTKTREEYAIRLKMGYAWLFEDDFIIRLKKIKMNRFFQRNKIIIAELLIAKEFLMTDIGYNFYMYYYNKISIIQFII